MLFIEFPMHLQPTNNLIKYKEVTGTDGWQYMYLDLETLNLLLFHFGTRATTRPHPTQQCSCDNESTGFMVTAKYCGTPIKMICGGKKGDGDIDPLSYIENIN